MAAGSTYTPILNYTVPSNVASVTIGSGGQGTIPSTYTDLVLVISGTTSASTMQNIRMQFNGVTSGTPYNSTRMLGVASGTPDSSNTGAANHMFVADGGNTQIGITINIPRYAQTNTNKVFLSRAGEVKDSTSETYYGLYMGVWNNTSAITSITIYHGANNLAAGMKFSLYGITAA